MKKQTPLEPLIEQLEEKTKDIGTSTMVHRRVKGVYVDAIIMAKSLLPYERECIEEAFDASKEVYSLDSLLPVYPTASDYYNSNYSQDKTETDGKD